MGDISDEDRHLDHIIKGRPRCFDDSLQVAHYLIGLCLDTRLDDLPRLGA